MDDLIVCLVAFLASGLTLFSGFGLGTLLMPAMALYFPLDVAIAMTAAVHFSNNLFKLALMGRQADLAVLWRFGIPAVFAACLGAAMLTWLVDLPSFLRYSAFGQTMNVSWVNVIIGGLILIFVILELMPGFAAKSVDPKHLPLGGVLSGFFGGLSGHQGAFRSLFLIKAGLDRHAFVATGVVLAVMVDVTRMLVYGWHLTTDWQQLNLGLIVSSSLAAFLGAYLGKRWLKKVTLRTVQRIVSAMLVVVSLGLMSGVI